MINDLRFKYRPLSNFWSCFIKQYGEYYPSVENAYQASKMENPSDREKFKFIKASEAKQLGRLLPMRKDWDSVKVDIMYSLVLQKFQTNNYLAALLLSTEDEEIQEGNWWGDTFWGTVNGKGENHLGKILMKVRSVIKEQVRLKDVMLS